MKSTVKKSLIIFLCLLTVLASLSIAPVTADDGSNSSGGTEKEIQMKSEFLKDSNFKSLGKNGNWDIAFEDGSSQLLVQTDTATVAVYDKASGHLWKTNLTKEDAAASPDKVTAIVAPEALSQVVISYFDSNNHKKTFTSYTNGVSEGRYEINNIENGIRVQYNIGQSSDDFYFPVVLRASTFEKLKSQMDETKAKTFERYYKFYSNDTLDDTIRANITNRYPIVKTEDIYVTTATAKLVKARFVRETLRDLGVDEDWIVDEYKAVGFTDYTIPDTANFDVTIDYTVKNGALSVEIPENGVVYTSKKCVIHELSLLPYFGTETGEQTGKMFIPDGSGALFDLADKEDFIVSLPFYGNDDSLRTKDYAEGAEHATLPVYGIVTGNDAFVANISKGAEVGSVEAHISNSVYPIPRVYTQYILNEYEEYSSQGRTQSATLVKYAKTMYSGPIHIDFYFLTGDKANYVGMASKIRDVYFSGKQRVSDTAPKFLFETYGAAIRKEYFLGYPLSKLESFTTVSEAKDMYDKLVSSGVSNIDVKYNNWSVDRYRNQLSKIGNLSDKVASKSEWIDFKNYLAGKNSSLYAAIDVVLDRDTGSVTAAPWHAKEIDGTLVTNKENMNIYTFGITDSLWRTVIDSNEMLKRIDSVNQKLDNLEIDAIAYDALGEKLFSNFNESHEVLRNKTAENYQQLLSDSKQNGKKVMVSTGNAYTLPYADMVTDLPMGDSRYYYEEQVPFLQIVLHGYVNYTGQAINLADSVEINYLKSVEYGAGLSYTLNEIESKQVKDTNYSELYTTEFERWFDDAVSRYKKLEEATGGTQSSVIVNHEKIQANVYRTTYENGTTVTVNYNSSDVVIDGVTVPATDFVYSKNN